MLAELLEISRFDAGAAVLDADAVELRDVVRRVVDAAEPIAEQCGIRIRSRRPRRGLHRRGGQAPDRADRAQPADQRPRARRGPGHPGPGRRRRERRRDRGPRPRRRAAAGGGRAGVQPVLARRPVAGPAAVAAPGSGCRSRSRTPGCTAAGCRPGGAPGGRAVPAHGAAARRRGAEHLPLPLEPADADAVRPAGTECRWPAPGGARPRVAVAVLGVRLCSLPESGPVVGAEVAPATDEAGPLHFQAARPRRTTPVRSRWPRGSSTR